ncbi:hypothetical protein [Williamsia sp. DF01-3]|uniref:hypothetical protein n=1 Tax=Williamsia sp. DF01-3 TaxID=2934157 RepID=UPI000DB84271|nr:hypothetical protein [Williamsia sp. DF01-3]MCK0515681.1 hypothetical protein [Williamsia sp. DF01-3]PZT95338.1 MAG: hypothetical protein DI630_24510 [Gordonia sp. (in: high G+C Gram-positive bacteria)]
MTTSSGNPIHDPTTSSPTSGETPTVDVAKAQAGDVVSGATDAGKHVASVAGDQASQVAGEATTQAKDLLHQTKGELTTQAFEQQKRVAGGLRALSDEFGSMADKSENQGVATDLTRQAAQHAQTVASWLDDREPGQILDEVTSFARRKPGTFLALAAGAGLVAGRLGRGLTAANSSNDSGSNPAPSPTPLADNTQTQPIAPINAVPPVDPGYGTGQHAAPPAQPGYTPEPPPYTVAPGYQQQPGYQQPPAPGVNP